MTPSIAIIGLILCLVVAIYWYLESRRAEPPKSVSQLPELTYVAFIYKEHVGDESLRLSVSTFDTVDNAYSFCGMLKIDEEANQRILFDTLVVKPVSQASAIVRATINSVSPHSCTRCEGLHRTIPLSVIKATDTAIH